MMELIPRRAEQKQIMLRSLTSLAIKHGRELTILMCLNLDSHMDFTKAWDSDALADWMHADNEFCFVFALALPLGHLWRFPSAHQSPRPHSVMLLPSQKYPGGHSLQAPSAAETYLVAPHGLSLVQSCSFPLPGEELGRLGNLPRQDLHVMFEVAPRVSEK